MTADADEPYGGRDNPASWDITRKFLDGFNDKAYARWQAFARETVERLDSMGARQDFRIGRSMLHIILSLEDSHDIEDRPRVTIDFDNKGETARVCYSRSNVWFHPPDSDTNFPRKVVVTGVLSLLRRLWLEVKPDAPLPHYLQ